MIFNLFRSLDIFQNPREVMGIKITSHDFVP